MREPPLQMVLDRLAQYLNRSVGPLERLGQGVTERAPLRMHTFAVNLCKRFGTNGPLVANPAGAGHSFDRQIALVSCLAEALERYCGCTGPDSEIIRATPIQMHELGFRCVPIEDCQFLRPDQLAKDSALRLFAPEHELLWIKGEDHSGPLVREIWLPLALISMDPEVSRPYCHGNSNGYAFGATAEQAKLWALSEILERDALMWFWWTKSVPPHFRVGDLKDFIDQRLYNELAPLSDRVWILDLSMRWGLPTFCIYIQGDVLKSELAVYWSAACRLDAIEGLRQCLSEGIRIFSSMKDSEPVLSPTPLDRDFVKSIRDMSDIAHLVRDAESRERCQFLLSGPLGNREIFASEKSAPGAGEAEAHLSVVIDRVRSKGARPMFFEMTTQDLKANEFEVWRAVVPESVPLNFAYESRPLGCLALRDRAFSELNDYPHLFM